MLKLIKLFFPDRCPYCGEVLPTKDSNGFCKLCINSLPFRNYDRYIDVIFDDAAGKTSVRRVRCVSVFVLEDKVKASLYRYKFSGKKNFGYVFAKQLYNKVKKSLCIDSFDFVTYVPLSKKSRKKRGYDQSGFLAKCFSEYAKIPVKSAIEKTKENIPQHTLKAKERADNIKGVFSVANINEVKDKNILLCDDIITTGNTLKECSKVLFEAGAKSVVCITLTANRELDEIDR